MPDPALPPPPATRADSGPETGPKSGSEPGPEPEATSAAEAEPRKKSRAARRVQLIEATIQTLALRGYARCTLAEVATRAGLSHGLVNFHFQSKEKLLSETLAYLAEEYRANWQACLARAGDDPAAQLAALLAADFDPRVCTPERLSAWCSFWGEAQARPLYQAQCASNDADYNRVLAEICARLIASGGYAAVPTRVARVLQAAGEGVWLDLMTMNPSYGLTEALAIVHSCAAAFFPRHFNEMGLIS